MKRPRVRFTVRLMMFAVAILATVMVIPAEEAFRYRQRAFHVSEEAIAEDLAMKSYRDGMAALSSGLKEDAARAFATSNWWAGQAHSHHVMVRTYASWIWLFGR